MIKSGFSPQKVLIVDDCAENRALLAAILKYRGVDSAQTFNGREALCMLEHNEFDMVFMDVQMPIMNGFEAAKAIRMKWPQRELALIAVSASVGALHRDLFHQAGFDGRIFKPISFHEIDALLSNVLHAVI